MPQRGFANRVASVLVPLWLPFGACALAAPAHAAEVGPPAGTTAEAEQLADRLLRAVGGRANWARATTLVNDSRQFRAEPPHTVRAVISIDLERPRFRIETTGVDLHLVRVIDGETDWRLTRAGEIQRVPADVRAEDARWYAGHVYRTLHRIARRDPALRLSVGSNGRLEVHEGDSRIAWYRVDARGEPYAFGGAGDDAGSLCGPWSIVSGGIRHPEWVARADGTWRAKLDRLEVGVPLDGALFSQPQRIARLDALDGSWAGEGRFRGQPARIRLDMSAVLEGAWRRLAVAIDAAGTRFQGEALYRRGVDGLAARWFDSSGQTYAVAAHVDAECIVATWAMDSGGRARSRYCLAADDTLTVVDSIADGERWIAFGEYALRRSRETAATSR